MGVGVYSILLGEWPALDGPFVAPPDRNRSRGRIQDLFCLVAGSHLCSAPRFPRGRLSPSPPQEYHNLHKYL